MRYNKRDLLIVFLLAILIFIFFSRLVLSDFIFYFKDFFRYFYPTRYLTSQWIREGIIPLWNPYNFCGMPFLASLQSQVLYPLSFIIYLLPINLGMKLFIVIHLFLAGVFTYFLMQVWGRSKTSSLIAGIVYIFSGYFLSVVDILNILVAITWLPFIFLFFIKALHIIRAKTKDQRLKTCIILIGVGICLQLLGGEPTTSSATLLTLLLFTLGKVVAEWSGQKKEDKAQIKIPLVFFLAVLIGLGLSAFQILPFLELVSHSTRGLGISFKEATRWSLAPYELLDLFINMFSYTITSIGIFNYVQGLIDSIYLGIIPLYLIFLGAFFSRLGLFWAFIFLSFILLSLGEYFPFYKWLYTFIPGFNLMQIPVKFFGIVTFAAALLAGFGYEHLKQMIKLGKSKLFLIVSISLFLVLLLIQIKFKIALLLHLKIEIILLILFSSLIILTRRGVITLTSLSVSIVCLILTDLFIAGADLNPMVEENFYQQKPRLAKLIEKEDEPCRILLSPDTSRFFYYHSGPIETNLLLEAHKAMIPNLGLLHKNVFDAYGYECLFLNDYYVLMRIITTANLAQIHQLLNLLNIKYIISRNNEEIKIYENPTYLKRAFLVSQVAIIKNRDEILRRMLKPDFDPAKEVILEDQRLKTKKQRLKTKDKVKIVGYQPNRIILEAASSSDCILFLSETYYPGWKAFIDGKSTQIYRANYTFRAVFLPKGSHKIEFIYFPLSLKIGILISLGTIISILVNRLTPVK